MDKDRRKKANCQRQFSSSKSFDRTNEKDRNKSRTIIAPSCCACSERCLWKPTLAHWHSKLDWLRNFLELHPSRSWMAIERMNRGYSETIGRDISGDLLPFYSEGGGHFRIAYIQNRRYVECLKELKKKRKVKPKCKLPIVIWTSTFLQRRSLAITSENAFWTLLAVSQQFTACLVANRRSTIAIFYHHFETMQHCRGGKVCLWYFASCPPWVIFPLKFIASVINIFVRHACVLHDLYIVRAYSWLLAKGLSVQFMYK